ncbi:uncharacterized protein METZ01_LOCUS329564, partial [marine metagenome]
LPLLIKIIYLVAIRQIIMKRLP